MVEGWKEARGRSGQREQWEASVACWDKNPSGCNYVGVTHVILSTIGLSLPWHNFQTLQLQERCSGGKEGVV